MPVYLKLGADPCSAAVEPLAEHFQLWVVGSALPDHHERAVAGRGHVDGQLATRRLGIDAEGTADRAPGGVETPRQDVVTTREAGVPGDDETAAGFPRYRRGVAHPVRRHRELASEPGAGTVESQPCEVASPVIRPNHHQLACGGHRGVPAEVLLVRDLEVSAARVPGPIEELRASASFVAVPDDGEITVGAGHRVDSPVGSVVARDLELLSTACAVRLEGLAEQAVVAVLPQHDERSIVGNDDGGANQARARGAKDLELGADPSLTERVARERQHECAE